MIDESGRQDDAQFGRDSYRVPVTGTASLIGAGLVGAAVGAATAWFLGKARAGDEPPIRVKGGSIHLDVLSRTTAWERDGSSGKKWKLTRGERSKEEITVWIVATGSGCDNDHVSGNKVRIEHTAGHWVEIKANDKKIKITDASKVLSPSNSDRRVTLDTGGYINKLLVDGDVKCEFNQGQLEELLLLDY